MNPLFVKLEDLKDHAEAYIEARNHEVNGIFHEELRKFCVFVEGKTAINDAIDLLTSNGYCVTEAPLNGLLQPNPPTV